MLAVERILQQLHNVVADSVFGGEALGPCKNFPLVQGGLFDGETEGKPERKGVILLGVHLVEGG